MWSVFLKKISAFVEIELLSQTIQEPLVHTIEYVSVASKETMEEIKGDVIKKPEGSEYGGAIISLALRLGKVRLIDNVILK